MRRAWHIAGWMLAACALSSPSGVSAQEAGVLDAGRPEAGVVDAGVPEGGVAATDAGLIADEPEEDDLPEELRPEIEYRIEPESGVMTGDLVHAIIVVRLRNENDDVAVPEQDLGELELHDQRHTDRRIDGRREFTFELDFLTLAPGEYEIAPIRLRIVTESGVIGSVHTEARTVTVGTLTGNEPDAQPRPATDPVIVMEDDYTLAWVLGILAAMLISALLGWLLARWWRARPKVAPPPPPPRAASEVALEKLRALRRRMSSALAEGKEGEIVDGASDVLREYLGARYDFNGLESTTDEVIARLRGVRLGQISLNEIIALLGDADLVKFAKAQPDEAQCDRMLEGAERIVRGTVLMATAISLPAAPRIDQTGPGKTKTDAVFRNEAGERVDHLGRRIPDTNPPPPPKPASSPSQTGESPAEPKTVPTLQGTIDGPDAASDAAAPPTDPGPAPRNTPVGHADPLKPVEPSPDRVAGATPDQTLDDDEGGRR